MSWGIYWGTWFGSPAHSPLPFSLVRARAYTNQAVLVTFTKPVFFGSPTLVTSVLNASLWTVAPTISGVALNIQGVYPMATDTEALVYLASPFKSTQVHRITLASTAMSADGTALSDPKYADFPGLTYTANQLVKTVSDLRNNQVPSSPTGCLVVGSNGDYARESGEALYRKLILRRLISAVNSFRHLPGYGSGIQEKEPISTTDMIALKFEVQSQVMLEPEVSEAAASIDRGMQGEITIRLQARLKKTNTTVNITYPMSPTAVSL